MHFRLRNLVIYRGEDNVAPECATGLTAQADENGIRLSWKPAADNVGVALYVISRAGGSDTTFAKIAQTTEPEYTDAPPAAGNYRYRVLAVDYERNLGPWSQDLSVQAGKAFRRPRYRAVEDSRWYAGHILAHTHEAGEGKVRKGTILFYGDLAPRSGPTRNSAAAMEGLLTHSCVNENGIRPCRPTARLLAELPAELE